jgi:hypothetical protein
MAAAPAAGGGQPAQSGPSFPMPSSNAFSILAQAPIDFTNMFSRQANEALNTLSLGTSQFAAALSLPALPFAAPQLPQLPAPSSLALPSFPGMGGYSGATSAPVAAQLYSSTAQALPVRKIGPRMVV